MGKVSMPQGKGSQLHNRREYEKIGKPIPDNIDSSTSISFWRSPRETAEPKTRR